MYTTHQKGQLAELEVQKRAIEKGMIPSKPLIESRYDLLIDDGNNIQKVQTKYVDSIHNDAINVDLRKQCRNNGKTKVYSKEEVDAIAAYIPMLNQICWLGPDIFHLKRSVSLRLSPPKNNQKKGILYAKDLYW